MEISLVELFLNLLEPTLKQFKAILTNFKHYCVFLMYVFFSLMYMTSN